MTINFTKDIDRLADHLEQGLIESILADQDSMRREFRRLELSITRASHYRANSDIAV